MTMRARTHVLRHPLIYCLTGVVTAFLATQARAESPDAEVARDGGHDFDFEIGTWNTHVSCLLHPLTGSTAWAQYDGTTIVRVTGPNR
jgi:hypothetical protein